ncbi:MAG: peptidylprolyl isomerase [Candidatus Diapherotrites archaeon]|uniref:Peptidyl-prolyl cis-trans isomerase n=1 Tax=Candidatus Iainarchaeum sp. TaxID=3101447 RepID=A0A2D6M195_9ARCH|nr:peptidylprolyl isomerase [Candidatus Diapherotrites archaeon]
MLLLAGCTQAPADTNIDDTDNTDNTGGVDVTVEVVEVGDNIKVEYRGSFEDGEVFDSSERFGKPLEFVAGIGRMIKGFDDAVIGMKLNDEKTITITAENAYGVSDPKRVVEIPRESINIDWNTLEAGTPISSTVAGNGVVLEKKEDSVLVDFNHPLAGKTLVFWIKVVELNKSQ